MTLPLILFLDDVLGSEGNEFERRQFCHRCGIQPVALSILTNPDLVLPAVNEQVNAFGVFCSSQRTEGKTVVNDVTLAREAAEVAWLPVSSRYRWSWVLLDLHFISGEIESTGKPKGRKGDERFGLEICRELKEQFSGLPLTMLTSAHQREFAELASLKYVSKDTLVSSEKFVGALLEFGHITPEQSRRLLQLPDNVIAESPETIRLFTEARRIAKTDSSVLLLGESGTGKEVLAQYIHAQSARSSAEIRSKNCAEIPESLRESVLFGHVKGSFTSAIESSMGLFREADGGTIFLDEVGELSLSCQGSLLRVLQEGVVQPVGSPDTHNVDVRLIAATNRNLAQDVRAQRFRQDLFFRLNQNLIRIPALKQRAEDLPTMVQSFLGRFLARQGKRGIIFCSEAIEELKDYRFPGNVRQLMNVVESIVTSKGDNTLISAKDIQEAIAKSEGKFEVSTEELLEVQEPEKLRPVTSAHLRNLPDLIASIPVDPHDPSLKGIFLRIDEAIGILKRRLGGAALYLEKERNFGKVEVAAVARLLTGDPNLITAAPKRVFLQILELKQNDALPANYVEHLIEFWKDREEHLKSDAK